MLTSEDGFFSLAESFNWATSLDVSGLRNFFNASAAQQVTFVASGGAFPVAKLAAQLYTEVYGVPSQVITPLLLAETSVVPGGTTVLVSAGASHPDIQLAAGLTAKLQQRAVALVTHRPIGSLKQEFLEQGVIPYSYPSSAPKDGFLATNSVITLATILVRALEFKTSCAPKTLRHFRLQPDPLIRRNSVILFGAHEASAASDLETRLSETDLATAQLIDYRNFAHGRHFGFFKNIENTTIVALKTPATASLADKTLDCLPSNAHMVELATSTRWPYCAIDLMCASMHVVSHLAWRNHLNTSKPGVPRFGRKLYRLSTRSIAPSTTLSPVAQKLGGHSKAASKSLASSYQKSFQKYLDRLLTTTYHTVVLDYDGTVCHTQSRFNLPADDIQKLLIDLLEHDVSLAFASGRGKSLYSDLRRWIPKWHWSSIILGLYNGGWIFRLADHLPALPKERPEIAALSARLRKSIFKGLVAVDARPTQISLLPTEIVNLGINRLYALVKEVSAQKPALPLKIVSSAHSIDVVPLDVSKSNVLSHISQSDHPGTLAIGDQGHATGNDFELLHVVPTSVSVDTVSSDPTCCWNLYPESPSGPPTLYRYLRSLKSTRQGVRMRGRKV